MFIAVYDMYEPCEKHELAFCGECGGQAKAFDKSLEETPLDQSNLPIGVRLAEYPGQCAGCSQNFGRESPIRYSDRDHGWVALACCG